VVRELDRNLLGPPDVQHFEHRRDVLVQQLALAFTEGAVEVTLEHLVTEPEMRDSHRPEALDAGFADEPVLVIEFLRQHPEQLSLVDLLPAAEHLHREGLAFDARDRQLLTSEDPACASSTPSTRAGSVPTSDWPSIQ
jgi:hypothetical protein